MKNAVKRFGAIGAGAVVALALVVGMVSPASAASDVVAVQSKSEAPEETVWTSGTPDPETCVVTDTGVLTVPGKRHDAETEIRYAYSQVIPGQTELTHQEYKYSRTVADFKTQYFFAKFTHTKNRTWIKEIPAQKAVYEKFTWSGPYAPIVAPPGEGWKSAGTTNDTKGSTPDVIQHQGNGNGSYFYFKTTKAAVPAVPGYWSAWSAYGTWTLWTPVQHTSWQDSNTPLGSPQFHGQGDTWYREWQAQPTGETRLVPNGSHVENTDWLTSPPAGDGWTQVDARTVKDREATADSTIYFLPGGEPTTSLTDANYTTENPGTPWVKVDEKRFETKAAYSDPDVVTNYSHTYKSEECVIPPSPANPTAVATAVCDAVDVVLTNPLIEDANQITASFVVFVDGDFYKAYGVQAGDREAFSVDGSHKVEVFQSGTSEWKLIASAESKTDCPVIVPPTEGPKPPVVTPPTKTPTPQPTATAKATGDLAQTGGESSLGLLFLAGLLFLGSATIVVARRIKGNN